MIHKLPFRCNEKTTFNNLIIGGIKKLDWVYRMCLKHFRN